LGDSDGGAEMGGDEAVLRRKSQSGQGETSRD
jgi:hypothetical protein